MKGKFYHCFFTKIQKINKIFGVEIYKPYVWETKFKIIDLYLNNSIEIKPEISIIHSSVLILTLKLLQEKILQKKF